MKDTVEEFYLNTGILNEAIDDLDDIKSDLEGVSKKLDKMLSCYRDEIPYELIGGGRFTLYYGAAKRRIQKRIETLKKSFVSFQTKLNRYIEENTANENKSTLKEQKEIAVKEEIYKVKAGDSLSKIAGIYGLTWEEIYAANKETIGDNPNLIEIGQDLKIPGIESKVSSKSEVSKEAIEKETNKPTPINVVNPRWEDEKTSAKKETKPTQTTAEKATQKAAEVVGIAEVAVPTAAATQTVNKEKEKIENSETGKDYRLTSFYYGDSYGSGKSTGSGKTISDFEVNDKGWYTYEGKLVLAGATEELLKNGNYSRQEGKHYFRYYDELTVVIDGVRYNAIILDSCGASMWEGETRLDLFVANSASAIDRGYKGQNTIYVEY